MGVFFFFQNKNKPPFGQLMHLLAWASTQQFVGFGKFQKIWVRVLVFWRICFLVCFFVVQNLLFFQTMNLDLDTLSLSLSRYTRIFISAGSGHIGINHTLKI